MSQPSSPPSERLEILDAFAELPDTRHTSGKRHQMALCLALFTLAVTASRVIAMSSLSCSSPPNSGCRPTARFADFALSRVFGCLSTVLWGRAPAG